jgi:hypothetical protein
MSSSSTDLAALAHAIDAVRKESLAQARRIDQRLAEGDNWFDIATSCAFRRQRTALGLMPWENPPMYGDIDQPRRDQHAYELLQKLLSLGLSRYEAQPLAAIARAEPL